MNRVEITAMVELFATFFDKISSKQPNREQLLKSLQTFKEQIYQNQENLSVLLPKQNTEIFPTELNTQENDKIQLGQEKVLSLVLIKYLDWVITTNQADKLQEWIQRLKYLEQLDRHLIQINKSSLQTFKALQDVFSNTQVCLDLLYKCYQQDHKNLNVILNVLAKEIAIDTVRIMDQHSIFRLTNMNQTLDVIEVIRGYKEYNKIQYEELILKILAVALQVEIQFNEKTYKHIRVPLHIIVIEEKFNESQQSNKEFYNYLNEYQVKKSFKTSDSPQRGYLYTQGEGMSQRILQEQQTKINQPQPNHKQRSSNKSLKTLNKFKTFDDPSHTEDDYSSNQEFKIKNNYLSRLCETMQMQLNDYLEEENHSRMSNNYSRSRVEQMHETSKAQLIQIK